MIAYLLKILIISHNNMFLIIMPSTIPTDWRQSYDNAVTISLLSSQETIIKLIQLCASCVLGSQFV